MARRIYRYGGHPPIPGESEKIKTADGSRGRMRLRIKKRARKAKRLLLAKEFSPCVNPTHVAGGEG